MIYGDFETNDINVIKTISLLDLEMEIIKNQENWYRCFGVVGRSRVLTSFMELLRNAVIDMNQYRSPYNQLICPSTPDPYVVAAFLNTFYDVIKVEDSRTQSVVAAIYVYRGYSRGAHLRYEDGLYEVKNEFCPDISDYDFRFALSVLANRTDVPVG